MPERPRKSTRLTVSLADQDYDALNAIAVANDASLSWVIRQAIRQYFDRTKKADEKQGTTANVGPKPH